MKWVAWLFVLVLAIPAEQWQKAPESEREKARIMAIQEHCKRDMEATGCRQWKIFEVIKDGFWQLHIIPFNVEA